VAVAVQGSFDCFVAQNCIIHVLLLKLGFELLLSALIIFVLVLQVELVFQLDALGLSSNIIVLLVLIQDTDVVLCSSDVDFQSDFL